MPPSPGLRPREALPSPFAKASGDIFDQLLGAGHADADFLREPASRRVAGGIAAHALLEIRAEAGDDAEQEYFADGISEDIITALSKLSQLFVIARNSSFTFKGKNVHIGEIGKSFGVRYVLEGSVRKSGGRVRITAQLI